MRQCPGVPLMSKHIRIPCPACGKELRVSPAYLGQGVACIPCGHQFRIPRHLRIPCPSCRELLRVPRGYVGEMIVCRLCEHTFLAQSPREPAPRAEGPPLPSGEGAAPAGSPAPAELVAGGVVAILASDPGVLVPEAQAPRTGPAAPAEILRQLDEAQGALGH